MKDDVSNNADEKKMRTLRIVIAGGGTGGQRHGTSPLTQGAGPP